MRWCGFEWVGNNNFFHRQTLDGDVCWEWTYVRGHRISRNYSHMPCTCIPIRFAGGLVCLSSVVFICLQPVSQYTINVERHDRALSTIIYIWDILGSKHGPELFCHNKVSWLSLVPRCKCGDSADYIIMDYDSFLDAVANLRKATISFVVCVCLSVRMEQLGFHRTDFREILYFRIFRKSIKKIQVSFKSDKNNGYFTWRCCPGSSVGIATGYKLDGPGIESRWGARFSAPVHTGPVVHPASCTIGTGSFPGVNSGRGVRLTSKPPSSAVVRKG
jgi:hypothetical protein